MSLQRGFSLVSMMVAVAIGIFITAGIVKMYVDSKVAYAGRSAVAAANENGRFALSDMRRTLLMTGASISVDDRDGTGKSIFEEPFGNYGTGVDSGITNTDGTGSDSIAIWSATGRSCTGALINVPTLSRFFVEDSELKCQVGNNVQPLVSGIESLQILWGVSDDGDNYADKYINAAQMDAAAGGVDPEIWKRVVALRIGVLASSGALEIPQEVVSPTSSLGVLDATVIPYSERKLYRVYQETISLRNMNAVNR